MKRPAIRLLIAEPNFSGGTEAVNLGLIPELTQLVECVVWAMPDYRTELYKKAIPPSARLIYEPLYWPRRSRFFRHFDGLLRRISLILPARWTSCRGLVARWREKIANAWLKHLIRRHRITHFFTTWIFNQEVPKLPIPIGAMVMDLNWHHFPENFPDSRGALDRSFAGWLREADVLFPISEFTMEEMRAAFPEVRSRVKVVPHGACVRVPVLRDTAIQRPNNPCTRPFFYYPAAAFCHKDHKTLILAAIQLFARGQDFDLVLSGAGTECFQCKSAHSNSLSESIRAVCLEHSSLVGNRIKSLGLVDRAEVSALYDGACAVVLPSRFEGFGLPLLEAIEHGARVICTDIPPFAEQIRRYDYSAYTTIFPAGAAAILSERMEAALKSQGGPRPLSQDIVARTQRWTWRDAAAAYVEAMLE